MMTVSSILARGFNLSWTGTVHAVDARCAVCAAPVAGQAVPVKDLIKPTASAVADTFRYNTDYTCVDCAACYGETRLLTGSLVATPSAGLKPTVSRQPDRPRWVDLILADRNEPAVLVMTSNTKRRLWPAAQVSLPGAPLPVLFVHEDTERLLVVDRDALAECLYLVTECLDDGHSKAAIASSLLRAGNLERLPRAWRHERELQFWRGRDEFLISLFIAQRQEEENTHDHVSD